tara:strand:- start:2450 stop:2755 length:306 start_codon:yes stop_codon:yes gene_type:complete
MYTIQGSDDGRKTSEFLGDNWIPNIQKEIIGLDEADIKTLLNSKLTERCQLKFPGSVGTVISCCDPNLKDKFVGLNFNKNGDINERESNINLSNINNNLCP